MVYTRPPKLAWGILGIALLGVSSGGPLLASMPEVPPFLRASWRLWATSIVLAPGLYVQRAWFFEQGLDLRSAAMVLMSGIALAVHFAAWTWSLDHTSLAHSLLFVTSHPIVIVTAMVIVQRKFDMVLVSGAMIGFLGAALALLDASPTGDVTYAGDAAAFVGAVAGAAYLGAGRLLRSTGKMPLFVYAFPVTFISAFILSLISVWLETPPDSISSHPLGWLGPSYFLPVSALALGAGLLGHTGLNASLRWMPPIIVSVALLFEPILGTAIGYVILGQLKIGLWTPIGGVLMIIGASILTIWLDRESKHKGTD